jgi:hypothetical protein
LDRGQIIICPSIAAHPPTKGKSTRSIPNPMEGFQGKYPIEGTFQISIGRKDGQPVRAPLWRAARSTGCGRLRPVVADQPKGGAGQTKRSTPCTAGLHRWPPRATKTANTSAALMQQLRALCRQSFSDRKPPYSLLRSPANDRPRLGGQRHQAATTNNPNTVYASVNTQSGASKKSMRCSQCSMKPAE